ncbi:MAG: IclR family transcriptional regulator, partial [Deltaproteobacteria bacterium]
EVARGPMRRLVAKARETAFVGVLNGRRVTILDVVESEEDLKVTSPIGTRVPLLAGALGKVFLAHMEEERARELLAQKGLPRYTEKSITDLDAYLRELKRVRQEGVAFDDEEYLTGIRAVAAYIETPVPPPAALWIVGFSATLTKEKMQEIAPLIKEAAEEIAKGLTGGT